MWRGRALECVHMPDKAEIAIGVSGRMGSGKSLIAHYFERNFGFQYLRYSLILAEWRGEDPEARLRLQEVGWDVMSGSGQEELNRRLIARIEPNRDVAIDGLRHPLDLENLRRRFGACFFLLFVHAPAEIRFSRLQTRYANYEEFVRADEHPVEANIEHLRPHASAEIDGALPNNQLHEELGLLVHSFLRRACL
jgi:dephospho-CoA kinase